MVGITVTYCIVFFAFSALTLSVGQQEGHPGSKKLRGVVLLQWNPDWFTFLVLGHPGSPGQRAVKRLCVLYCLTLSHDWLSGTGAIQYDHDVIGNILSALCR